MAAAPGFGEPFALGLLWPAAGGAALGAGLLPALFDGAAAGLGEWPASGLGPRLGGVEPGEAGVRLHAGQTLRQRCPAAARCSPVVDVDGHPVDIRVARIEHALVYAGRVPDVWVPNELHVGRAGRDETIMNMSECGDVLRRRIAVDAVAPRVPVAVHLVPEIEHHGTAVGPQPYRPRIDVWVESAGGY